MKKKQILIVLALVVFYLAIHLPNLTLLPVFADESIYIRWTQLIIDDARRYLFYPMNDGKTPLVMWLMLPFQFLFKDQLFAGRILAVILGLFTVLAAGLIARQFFKKEKEQNLAQIFAMFLMIILPFPYFHHRMALTDAALLCNLTLTYYFALRYIKEKRWPLVLATAFCFFLSMMSKISALLFLPPLVLLVFYQGQWKFKKLFKNALGLGVSIFLGFLGFYAFRLVPLFPQLFSRGSDFLYPFSILFKKEIFSIFYANLGYFAKQYFFYLTAPIIFFAFILNSKNFNKKILLILSTLAFIIPLALLGKVVYPRYLLPASLFFILAASLSLVEVFSQKKLLVKIASSLLLVITFWQSGRFIYYAQTDTDQIPFSAIDRMQYLEEWSSGHGIKETVKFIQETSQKHSLAVATEGFFGTLPDGILMYLHRQNVDNLKVEGIGQPVRAIPVDFISKAEGFDQKLLVVNSHRLKMDLPEENLIKEYCRPNNTPCLQIWDITNLSEFQKSL